MYCMQQINKDQHCDFLLSLAWKYPELLLFLTETSQKVTAEKSIILIITDHYYCSLMFDSPHCGQPPVPDDKLTAPVYFHFFGARKPQENYEYDSF